MENKANIKMNLQDEQLKTANGGLGRYDQVEVGEWYYRPDEVELSVPGAWPCRTLYHCLEDRGDNMFLFETYKQYTTDHGYEYREDIRIVLRGLGYAHMSAPSF